MTGGYSLLVANLIGVAVFAASGARRGGRRTLGLFGVAFVGFVAVPPVGACLVGACLVGLLTSEIPTVLRRDIYAWSPCAERSR